jgi:hypothetical protein
MRGTASSRINRALLAVAASLALGLPAFSALSAFSAFSAQARLISPQAVARLRAIAREPSAVVREPAKPMGIVRGHKVG